MANQNLDFPTYYFFVETMFIASYPHSRKGLEESFQKMFGYSDKLVEVEKDFCTNVVSLSPQQCVDSLKPNVLASNSSIYKIAAGIMEAADFADIQEEYPDAVFSSEATLAAINIAKDFVREIPKKVAKKLASNPNYTLDRLGNDLYYTIAGHGVGFLDRESEGLSSREVTLLDNIAKTMRKDDIFYVGDHGFVYPYPS